MWKHLHPIIKYLFLRNNRVCPIWNFIFDTDQAQINSVGRRGVLNSAIEKDNIQCSSDANLQKHLFTYTFLYNWWQQDVILGGRGDYSPGDIVHLNCTSYESKPAADLTWYINDEGSLETILVLFLIYLKEHKKIFGSGNQRRSQLY